MFTSEQNMVDTFELLTGSFLRNLYGKPVNRHFAIREFDSHHGVADIVLGTYRSHLSSRWTRKPINENWLAPLFKLQNGAVIQLDSYADQFCVSRTTARRQIQEYVEANFLKPIGSDQFKLLRNYEPVINGVVSIEAKLSNWKQAMSQALRYRRFSDYVFVLLDDDRAEPAIDKLYQFEEWNVGLATMSDSSDTVSFYHVPERITKKSDYYYNRLNETAYSQFVSAFATC